MAPRKSPRMTRWIQGATSERTRGALHRMLRVPEGERIPLDLLREAAEYPERFYSKPSLQRKLQDRAQFALNVRPRRMRKQ